MLAPERERERERERPPFYWQIRMAELVLPFSLHNSRTGTSGFLKFKNQITTLTIQGK